MNPINVAILKNEDPYDHLNWVKACEDHKDAVQYRIIDLMKQSWMEDFRGSSFDCLLVRPGAKTSVFRNAYQERVEILATQLGYRVFPSLDELRIYENKRYLSYWLAANNIPHPATWTFYNKKDALNHISTCPFPLVGKINVGTSGDGVQILKGESSAREYIDLAFSSGLRNRTGPKLTQRNLLADKFKKLAKPRELANRIKGYRQVAADAQTGFVILQEYIPHDFEWRIVRIGESFFAHKKIKSHGKASGSLLKEYENPPLQLLDFVKDMTDTHHFYSQAADIFIAPDGRYLINELQCIFGQSDPFQMKVDGKVGRYVQKDHHWIFQEGDFNQNESFNLRVAHVIASCT